MFNKSYNFGLFSDFICFCVVMCTSIGLDNSSGFISGILWFSLFLRAQYHQIPIPFPLAGGSVVEAVFGLLTNVVPVFPLLFQKFFQFIVNYQSSSVSFFGIVSNFSSCGFLYNGSEVISGPLFHPKILLP